MKRSIRYGLGVVFVFLVVFVGLFTLAPSDVEYNCNSNILLNPNFWTKKYAISQHKLSGEHQLILLSYDSHIRFSLQEKNLFASKLQELNFWDEAGALVTESQPRKYVQPKNLCIIVSPELQSFDQHIDESNTVYQASSTSLIPDTGTLILSVYFNPEHFQKQNLSPRQFGFALSYSIMSTLYSVTLPPSSQNVSLEFRYQNADSFLAPFKYSDDINNKPLFNIRDINW